MLTLIRSGTIASNMWKNVDAEEKKYWQDRADEVKAEHARLHPGYEVQPRKSSEISRRSGSKSAEKAAEGGARRSAKKSKKVAQRGAQTPDVLQQQPIAGALQPVDAQQPVQPYVAQQQVQPYFPQQPVQQPPAGLNQPSYEAPGYNMTNLSGPGFGMPAQFTPQGYQPMAPPFFGNGNYQNAGAMPQEGFGGYNNQQFQQVGDDNQNFFGGNMGFGAGQPGNYGWY